MRQRKTPKQGAERVQIGVRIEKRLVKVLKADMEGWMRRFTPRALQGLVSEAESRARGLAAVHIGGVEPPTYKFTDRVLGVRSSAMDRLTAFGVFAVSAMLVCYVYERRSPWFVLGFAGACALGSIYGFLQGAWPFGLVEAVWAGVALRRWLRSRAQHP